jgi:hypothetical protein
VKAQQVLKIAYAAVILLACPALRAQSTPAAWDIEVVDSNAPVGGFRSLAFTPAGVPIAAYSDDRANRVRVATGNANGIGWSIETIGSGSGGISLALIPATPMTGGTAEKPSVSWANSKLYFASKASGAWATTTIESGGINGQNTSLAYSPAGEPAISYYSEAKTGAGLKFAWRSGTTWRTQFIDAGARAKDSSLVFGPAGNAMILYGHDSDNDGYPDTVKFMEGVKTPTGYTWSAPLVLEGPYGQMGMFSSLAVDSSGNPVGVHRGTNRPHLLRRLSNLDGSMTWRMDKVETDAYGTGCQVKVAQDTATGLDRVFVSYISIQGNAWAVRVATALLPVDPAEPLSWTWSQVDPEGAGPGRTSIAVSGGVPSVIYPVAGRLRMATQVP